MNTPGLLELSRDRIKLLLRLPLYSNALYLLMANGLAPVLGMAYWVLAARLYPPDAVGFASAAMAGAGIIVLFCHLGLSMGLVRFLAQSGEDAERIINTVYTTGILTALAGAVIFLAGIHIWSQPLESLRANLFYMAIFVVYVIGYNMGILIDDTFVAERRASFVFVRSIFFNVFKLALLALLAFSLPGVGILASWTAALWISLMALVFLLPKVHPGYRPRISLDMKVLKDILPYSMANQFGSVLSMAPSMIMPILVIDTLGAEPTAYFSIAAAVTTPLTMVSGAFSTSLFAEGSYEEGQLALNARRSFLVTYAILVPAMILAILLAPYVLLIFGQAYSTEGTWVLRILAVASLPMAFNSIYISIKRVQKELKAILVLAAVGAASTVGLTVALLPGMGANGAAVASLGSQCLVMAAVGVIWVIQRQGRKRAA